MKMKVLFFLHLIQDLDVLKPILNSFSSASNLQVSVMVSHHLSRKSPRVLKYLNSLECEKSEVNTDLFAIRVYPKLDGCEALITASESTAKPHRAAYQLTQFANAQKIKTFTMQHGIENIGLTYFDELYTPDNVEFASNYIFTWCPKEGLHSKIKQSTQNKCVSIGRPNSNTVDVKMVEHLPSQYHKRVMVFENLHWNRYSGLYRESFISDLKICVEEFKNILFVLKPHHDQRWSVKKNYAKRHKPANFICADPKDPQWEPFTAQDMVGSADLVVTTPSTVALDAAQNRVPTVIAGYDESTDFYKPLIRITSLMDWKKVLTDILHDNQVDFYRNIADEFADQFLVKDGGVDAVLRYIQEVCHRPMMGSGA